MISKTLDQFYTKEPVAAECIRDLRKIIQIHTYDILLEPSAGTGAFFNQLDSATRIGLDIAPRAAGIIQKNFFKYLPPADLKTLVIGNPPFGVQSTLAIKFFQHAAKFADTIAFIVPITWNKYSIHRRLPLGYRLIYSKPLAMDSFIFNGEDYNVKCAFQIWTCRKDLEYLDKRIYTAPPTTHPDFIFLPKDKKLDADFLLVVCGSRQQLVHEITSTIAVQTTERIKALVPGVRKIFESIDWTKHFHTNTATMWINRATIVKEYAEYKKKLVK